MTDRKPLSSEPFSFRQTKGGLVQLFYGGEVVTTLAGKQALRFIDKAANLDARGLQLLMARATGHFKHGNER